MRVFVLGTGRCGTMTFARACVHITNYTSGHETRALRPAAFDYPDRHIEVDGRLSRCVFALVDRYPNAFYVHLIRERRPCVESLADWGVAHQFAAWVWGGTAIIQDKLGRRRRTTRGMDRETALRVAGALWDHGNAAIKAAIPSDSLTILLETLAIRWPEFWRRIGAQGDLEAAKRELMTRHNAGRPETNVWDAACQHRAMKTEPRL